MASSESETTTTEVQSMLETLITSRNRDLSIFLPFLLGFDPDPTREQSGQSTTTPDHNSGNNPTPDHRIVLINPVTQGMVVIEGTGFDSLFRGIQSSKGGQPPAAKSAIEAMPRVEITTEEEKIECVICLEECGGVGEEEVVKEMPCKHRFHGKCIEKWLGLHGSCPVCRYTMPCDTTVAKKIDGDGNEGNGNGDGDGGERRGRSEVWVSFSIGQRRGDGNGNGTSDGNTEDVLEGNGRELDSGESGNQNEE